MSTSTSLPQPSPAATAADDRTATARLPFVAPAVSDLGKLAGLTQLGTSSL